MRLSNRLLSIVKDGSDGWEVFLRARRMIAEGTEVIELTIGEHDIRTQSDILEAMHTGAARGNTGYSAIPGQPELRRAIAKRVERHSGVATTWENVLVVPGAQAGLFAAHTAALDPGETGLYVDPFYTTYPGVIRGVGARAVAVKARAEDGFQPREEPLATAAAGARSLLINSPNNPTGVLYSRATMESIARVCQSHDLWLISDEVYDSQVWTGTHLSPRALPGMAARTLMVGSLSKSHAMTGSRVGWIVADPAVIANLANLSVVTTYGLPGFIQDAATFALAKGDAFEREIAETFRRRRALALDILKGANAIRVVPPSGAMYLMLDIRATGLSGEAFANALLDAERIAVMPGESFGSAAAGHIRVAMTIEDSLFADALGRLADFAAQKAA